MEVGRHVKAVLDEQRARGVARVVPAEPPNWAEGLTSGVHTVLPPGRYPAPDDRELYERMGVLYTAAESADIDTAVFPNYPEPDEGPAVQALADFLDTVRHALLRPDGPTAAALLRALTRYERDRTGA